MCCSKGVQVPVFQQKVPQVMMFHVLEVHPTAKIIMTAQLDTSSLSCMSTGDMTFLELQFWKVKNVLEYSFSSVFLLVFWGFFIIFIFIFKNQSLVDQ